MKYKRPLARAMALIGALAMVLAALGCVGGPGPKERYLRLETSLHAQPPAAAQDMKTKNQRIVAIRGFESLPALQRTAVLHARGKVLTPSVSLYWEGTPAELVTAAMVDAISARPGLGAAWPYRSRTEHSAVVSGSVAAFEVVQDAGTRVRIRIRVDLWSRLTTTHMAGRTFEATQDAGAGTPDATARAAEKALDRVAQDAAAWIKETVAGE